MGYISESEILRRYSAGERDFSHVQVFCSHMGRGFAGANLSGANFSGANLVGVNLEGANLEGVNFTDAKLSEANLRRANLRKANLRKANLCVGRDYAYMGITHEVLDRAFLDDADLTQADLSKADMRRCSLKKASLQEAIFEETHLDEANLRRANLREANLKGANLRNVDLFFADLTGANLEGANLDGADLIEAILPDGSVNKNEGLDLIRHKISHLKKSAWKPVVSEGDGDLKASKFAGKPWLSAGEQYPTCPNCQNPMEFILQLNLDELPTSLYAQFGKGLVQLFYCFEGDCDCVCEGWEAFSPVQVTRIIHSEGEPAEFEMPERGERYLARSIEGPIPAKLIAGWEEVDDYPDWIDAEALGVRLSDDELITFKSFLPNSFKRWYGAANEDLGYDDEIQSQYRCSLVSDFIQEVEIYAPQKDKLAGYPHWVQGNEEYSNCPTCGKTMNQLIAQLESDDNVPVLWGDVGAGYLVQCPEHKDQVAFFWQCG